MEGSRVVSILCMVLLFTVCIQGILVTKDMRIGVKRDKNLDLLHQIGAKYANGGPNAFRPPVVIIPGIGGSQLVAQLNKTTGHFWCDKTDPWYVIWLHLNALIPGPQLECWCDNFQMVYNTFTDSFSNIPGVQIVPNYPNSTLGFEYLDPVYPEETIYFAGVVTALTAAGYTRGVNLFGAPYDWRVTPNYVPGYYAKMQSLIENAYYSNGNTPVAMLCHSMGNLYFMSFLRTMPQSWKDQFIFAHLAVSPPTIGAASALNSLISGDDFGIPFFPNSASKTVAETFISNYFLLPNPDYYGDIPLVFTPQKNYSANDYKVLLYDLGLQDMYAPYIDTYNIADPVNPTGLDTYLFYGWNLSTIAFEATNNNFGNVMLFYGDGDGTVPTESLTFMKYWENYTDKTVWSRGYANQDHVKILMDDQVVMDLLCVIFNYTHCK